VELIDAFVEITKGFVIPAGSVLLVSSASQLAGIGTEGYAAEFDIGLRKLNRVMGGITMLHGLPILSTGTENFSLIRSILDIEHWVNAIFDGRDIARVRKYGIKLAFGKSIEQFSAGEDGGLPGVLPGSTGADGLPGAPYLPSTRLMLPVLGPYVKKVCFESPKYISVPLTLDPINEGDEKNLVEMLAQVLNQLFMTDLALEICTARENALFDGDGTDSSLLGKRFILIGASHAMRLALAMEDMGAVVIDLSIPGWRSTPDTVTAAISDLNAVLDEEFSGETILIFQLYDNSCFLSCDPDGNTSLPTKRDNVYHVPGRLTYVDRGGFRELFTTTLPLLRAGRNHVKILLTPLMSYTLESCYKDSTHIINRSEPNFGANLGAALGNIKDWLQDLAFTRRIHNFAVLCPTEVMQRAEQQRSGCFWTQGPGHMNTEGYRFLGAALLEQFADVKLSRKVEPKGPSTNNQRLPDRAATRMSWVGGNDSAVHRVYDQLPQGGDQRGGVHGGNRGRGRGRGRGSGYRGWRGRGPAHKKFYKNGPN
jgi:hypothetical protein